MAGAYVTRARTGTGQNTNPASVTFPSPPANGNKLIAMMYGTATGTFNQSGGSDATRVIDRTTNLSVAMFYIDADGTQDTWAFTLDAGGSTSTKWLVIEEYSGLAPGPELAGDRNQYTGSNVTTHEASLSTTPASSHLSIAFYAWNGTVSAWNPDLTNLHEYLDTSSRVATVARIENPAAATTWTGAWTTARNTVSLVAAFAEASEGGEGGESPSSTQGLWGPIRGI